MFLWFAGGLFCALGLWLLWIGVGVARRTWASRRWPAIEGWEIEGRVQTSVPTRNIATYIPYVTFTYQLGCRDYEREESLALHGRIEAAERALARWPVGESAPVLYDPERPDEGYLEPAVKLGSLIFGFCMAFALLAAGVLILWSLVN